MKRESERTNCSRQRARRWLSIGVVLLAFAGVVYAAGVVVEKYGAATVFGYTTSGVYDPEDAYQVRNLDCVAKLKPTKVTEVPAGDVSATSHFNTLSTAYPGYTYASAVNNLSAGSLEVKTYDVQGTPARVGAEIHVVYKPGIGDPMANVHWIQVVTDNHNVTGNPGHGNAENVVDVAGTATSPYYDDGFAANGGGCLGGCDFYDFPGRTDTHNDHTWEAVTFIVTGPAPGTTGQITTHYPGFRWGWMNACTPRAIVVGTYAYNDQVVTFVTNEVITPGAVVTFDLLLPAHMILGEEGEETLVDVLAANVAVAIDEEVNHRGDTSYQVVAGFGALGPFTLGGMDIDSATFEIESGDGYVNWETGELGGNWTIRSSVPGFPDVVATAHGVAQLNVDDGSVSLEAGSEAFEITDVAIPDVEILAALLFIAPWIAPTFGAAGLVALGMALASFVAARRQALPAVG